MFINYLNILPLASVLKHCRHTRPSLLFIYDKRARKLQHFEHKT